ncbi:uncharacterized protein LOC143021931 isoform X2 [Oratosquilla oratoria]|uniref:uncharacterized protein LOC143021931 isoform X2 n=1 Tax=Oratosquilla oratoria TaxID=337810 RepID=UPI003F76E674
MIGGQLQTCTGQVSAEGARRRCLQCQATPPSVDFLQTQYQANWPSRGGTTGLATAVVHYGCEDRPRNFTKYQNVLASRYVCTMWRHRTNLASIYSQLCCKRARAEDEAVIEAVFYF